MAVDFIVIGRINYSFEYCSLLLTMIGTQAVRTHVFFRHTETGAKDTGIKHDNQQSHT